MTQQVKTPPTETRPAIVCLSLGWGVQSFTIACMIALGELPPIGLAIHADTTHEAQGTYDHAGRWIPWLEERGVKVVTVQGKRMEIVRPEWGTGSVMIPAFSESKTDGSKGQIRRQCTHDWKIMPIRRHIRSLLPVGRPKPGAVECWQGISLDEWPRMRSSDVAYIVNRYPLVEMQMSRADCAAWLTRNGLEVPPKSACTFCPYHSLNAWKEMKRQGGKDWEEVQATDAEVRDMRDRHILYLHPARRPIEEAVRIPEDHGARQLELELEAPCDGGVCFV